MEGFQRELANSSPVLEETHKALPDLPMLFGGAIIYSFFERCNRVEAVLTKVRKTGCL